MYNCVWYLCTYPYGLSLNGWHALLCIAKNCHGVTITKHAIKRQFLTWMTMVRQPTKRWPSCVLTSKYTFICVYWWTRQRIRNGVTAVLHEAKSTTPWLWQMDTCDSAEDRWSVTPGHRIKYPSTYLLYWVQVSISMYCIFCICKWTSLARLTLQPWWLVETLSWGPLECYTGAPHKISIYPFIILSIS